MAELIPSINTCLSKMEPGEKRFAYRLESLLEDDYLCWYDIPLGGLRGHRRYLDFIVLHPARGLLFLEVKDWKPDQLKGLNAEQARIVTKSGRLKTVANPMAQARQCSYKVINALETDPQLQQLTGPHKGKLCIPYGYGVVFTNITRRQFDQAIPEESRQSILPSHNLICKDEMTESADAETFQERLWAMFSYQFGEMLTLPQIDRIRWHLFPEIRIDYTQQSLFNDDEEGNNDPQTQEVAENIPDIIKIMDVQQEQLARSMGDGHRVVHGVAGSGKTLILGYRCLYLAEALNKPILVLCFNITLAVKLRAFIDDKGISAKVQVYHFHDWCGTQLRAYHVDLVKSDKEVWERQVDSVIKAVDEGRIPKGQYGALLIDEGNDFEAEWLRLVTQMVDPDTNSLLLLYDDAQSIYKKKSGLDFSLASVGIQAQGRTTILRLNYRNTREILEFAYQFAKDYFSQSNDKDIPLVAPEAAGKSGEKPTLHTFNNLQEEINHTLDYLQSRAIQEHAWADIAILYPTGYSGRAMYNALNKANIPCHWLASSNHKKAYKPNDNKIALMPIPSSKGLEFDTVIIIDASFCHQSEKHDENPTVADDIRRLYVGMTRAQNNLLVSYHRKNTISALWHKT